jgi:hypothetical protein
LELGLFNGLRAIGIKKFFLPRAGGSNVSTLRFSPLSAVSAAAGRLGFDQPKVYGRFPETPRLVRRHRKKMTEYLAIPGTSRLE